MDDTINSGTLGKLGCTSVYLCNSPLIQTEAPWTRPLHSGVVQVQILKPLSSNYFQGIKYIYNWKQWSERIIQLKYPINSCLNSISEIMEKYSSQSIFKPIMNLMSEHLLESNTQIRTTCRETVSFSTQQCWGHACSPFCHLVRKDSSMPLSVVWGKHQLRLVLSPVILCQILMHVYIYCTICSTYIIPEACFDTNMYLPKV